MALLYKERHRENEEPSTPSYWDSLNGVGGVPVAGEYE